MQHESTLLKEEEPTTAEGAPTSRAIARRVFQHLKCKDLPINAVTIEETCTSVCTYRE